MDLSAQVLQGILLPFWGTTVGAAAALFLRRERNEVWERLTAGFAAGVMAAASVWSLLMPALEQSAHLGRWSFVPAVTGFWAGVLFLMVLEELLPLGELGEENRQSGLLALAVTLHNVPEGMAVGVAYAALISHAPGMSCAGAFALSLGIALQNIPEGAIISLPLRAGGMRRGRALLWGVLSGAVEPVAGGLTVLSAAWVTPVLPFLLSLAAGTMFCVVVEELIPSMAVGDRSKLPVLAFSLGFTLMLGMDVGLG